MASGSKLGHPKMRWFTSRTAKICGRKVAEGSPDADSNSVGEKQCGWVGLVGTHLRFLLRCVSLSKSALRAVETVGAGDAKTCPRILGENHGALAMSVEVLLFCQNISINPFNVKYGNFSRT